MQSATRRFLSLDARAGQALVPTYGPPTGVRMLPNLVFTHGRGALMYDEHGKEYIDMSAGIAVSIVGHGDKPIAKAVNEQLLKITHCSNLFHTEPPLALAERLLKVSPGFKQVFLCNSGTEANEGALKFARLAANAKGESRSRVIAFKSSFHGRSLGALSVTYKPAIRTPFGTLVNQNVDFCEFNDLKDVEDKMAHDVMAIIVEPVQGEGGVNPAQVDFLKGLRALCNKYDSMLIFDEIQIGLGRGGTLWGHEPYGVKPDLMSLAKPLAGGLPIGAVMMAESYVSRVPATHFAGAHGTTFGGNPAVSAAALSILDRLEDPAFMKHARVAGARLIKGLDAIAAKHPNKIIKVRRPIGDQGLYAGVLLKAQVAGDVVKTALKDGAIFITAGDKGDTIRICPPLVITEKQVDDALAILDKSIAQVDITKPNTYVSSYPAPYVPVSHSPPLETYDSLEAYKAHLAKTCPLPQGFVVGADKLTFVPKELGGTKTFPMRLSLIALEKNRATTSYAVTFTRNAFPGAPILLGREIVSSGAPIGGILINNKISNVQPRGGGVKDSAQLIAHAAKLMGMPPQAQLLPASTGVIGWSLPVPEMIECLPKVVRNLSANASALVAAEAIMTTDRYPKARTRSIKLSSGTARVTGVAKGAGMIEPNMGTMLVYLMTDAKLPKKDLHSMLTSAVNGPASFNRITVDSDQSTSDMCVLLSSDAVECSTEADKRLFAAALKDVCAELAEDIVRNGEGTRHVIRVQVYGAPSEELAHGAAKAVANSPLVKCAVFGNDPNVGRILAALGSYLGRQQSHYIAKKIAPKATVKVGGVVVYEHGEFALDSKKEAELSNMMKNAEMDFSKGDFPPHNRLVQIDINLNSGDYGTIVLGSDLSQDYVDVNADYRS